MFPRKIPAAAVAAMVAAAVPGVLGAQSADSKYDSGTTMFSPKGRLYQVEYASEVRYTMSCRFGLDGGGRNRDLVYESGRMT